MDLKLQGRVVAITGGASGIGRSCALRYLEEGCRVAVCGRNRAKLEVFRRHCREAGHEVLCVEADVADTEALERFADTAVSHFGRLDVWYNNAGSRSWTSALKNGTGLWGSTCAACSRGHGWPPSVCSKVGSS